MRSTGMDNIKIGENKLEATKSSMVLVIGRRKTSKTSEITAPTIKSSTECMPK